MRWQKSPTTFSKGVLESEGVNDFQKWALAQSYEHEALAAA